MGGKVYAYVDTETTGLGDQHELWELAIVRRDGDSEEKFSWQFPVKDLSVAEPAALRVGRFLERRGSASTLGDHYEAGIAYRLLDGAVLAGINPAFDERMLAKFFVSYGLPPRCHHYTLFDVKTYALGVGHATALFALDEEPKTDQMLEIYGVVSPEGERHTALGDALAARALHQAAIRRADAYVKRAL